MAAYAAVLSLFHVMENIKIYRLRDPKFLDEQKIQLESLNENVIFLQDFLETYSSQAGKDENLEIRIADAAYAAEDIIETYIVDYLHDIYDKSTTDGNNVAESTTSDGRMSSNHFSLELQKVLQGIDFLEKEAMAIKKSNQFQVQQLRDHLVPAANVPTSRNGASVELFRDEMNEIVDKLTRGQPNLLTCSIVGMGGTGKTTLAKNIHENPIIVHRFDIRGWVTASQQFNVRELLVGLLRDIKALGDHDESLDEHQLREKLHKHLFGRRYLIVVDDVWDVGALDTLNLSLPDNHNGSRIMVTTRMSNVATRSSFIHKMNFLDESKSWELFSDLLFGKEGCPPELKEFAEIVAGNCKGLLLALSVLGGLLANSNITHEYLEYIAQDTTAVVNSTDEDHCLEILSTSYNNVPVHLKPCFLYLGVYKEDLNIPVNELIRLWVSEGLLKPSKIKSMEEVADDNLKDLIGRNLILVSKFDRLGDVKYCKMHDLVRDLCLREARKERFLYVTKFDSAGISQGFDSHRRVAIHNVDQLDPASQSSLSPRSLIHKFGDLILIPFHVKLLRVLSTNKIRGDHFKYRYFNGFNLRYISTRDHTFPSSIHLFWNLQSLLSFEDDQTRVTAPPAIWEIPQLRHVWVESGFYLSDPLVEKIEGQDDDIVLENLQGLGTILDFTCTEEVLRKIPNVQELVVLYKDSKMFSTNCLENLGRLQKLVSLACNFVIEQGLMKPSSNKLLQTLEFPVSLRELTLTGMVFNSEYMGGKIGSLPHLEKLVLQGCNWEDNEWETVEGQFLHLKCLKLKSSGLVSWKTDSAHFPCLEHLGLECMHELEEIPSEIGDIPTLRSIKLFCCNGSVDDAAIGILEEQRYLGNEDLIVTINRRRVRLD